jgi:hypothetical protein
MTLNCHDYSSAIFATISYTTIAFQPRPGDPGTIMPQFRDSFTFYLMRIRHIFCALNAVKIRQAHFLPSSYKAISTISDNERPLLKEYEN